MIYQLQKYVSKTLLMTTIPVVFLVLGIDFLFAYVHELNQIARGNYTVLNAFIYVVLTLPQRLYEFFPMTSLIGVLLGLGLLASHSELIVMRASGVSIARIAGMVFQFGLVLAVFMALMGEYVIPKTQYWADAYRVHVRSAGQAVLTVQGTWVRDQNNFIHIQSLQEDARIEGITYYEFDETLHLKSVSHIKDAVYADKTWHLNEISRSDISPTEVTTSYQDTDTMRRLVDPDILSVALSDPNDLSMRGLYQYARYLKENGLDYKPFALNFWQKALQPLATVVMILLSVPFIFGPLRSSSMGLRLLAGIVVGFGFYVLSEIFGPLFMVYQLPPFFAALSPILIFGLIGIFLIHRVEQHK